MSDEDVVISEEVRAAGRGVLERLDSDASYRERFASDPAGVLQEAGIPEAVMPALATAAISDGDEVEGFAIDTFIYFLTSSCTSNCPPLPTEAAVGPRVVGATLTLCAKADWYR